MGNAFHQRGQDGIALRLIPNVIRTYEELKLPPILESFHLKITRFLFVWDQLDKVSLQLWRLWLTLSTKTRAEHIVTIEDPIEYVYQEEKS